MKAADDDDDGEGKGSLQEMPSGKWPTSLAVGRPVTIQQQISPLGLIVYRYNASP